MCFLHGLVHSGASASTPPGVLFLVLLCPHPSYDNCMSICPGNPGGRKPRVQGWTWRRHTEGNRLSLGTVDLVDLNCSWPREGPNYSRLLWLETKESQQSVLEPWPPGGSRTASVVIGFSMNPSAKPASFLPCSGPQGTTLGCGERGETLGEGRSLNLGDGRPRWLPCEPRQQGLSLPEAPPSL